MNAITEVLEGLGPGNRLRVEQGTLETFADPFNAGPYLRIPVELARQLRLGSRKLKGYHGTRYAYLIGDGRFRNHAGFPL